MNERWVYVGALAGSTCMANISHTEAARRALCHPDAIRKMMAAGAAPGTADRASRNRKPQERRSFPSMLTLLLPLDQGQAACGVQFCFASGGSQGNPNVS